MINLIVFFTRMKTDMDKDDEIAWDLIDLYISAGSILTEIEKSTILRQFFRIEIEPKSIFINLQNRQKTEIEKNSLFWNQI